MAQLPDGFGLIELDRTDSTNDEARRRIQAGTAPGTVVWARRQSAGRGRRGREWESPPGNLFVSIAAQPSRPASEYAQLSFLTALCVAETVEAYLPREAVVSLKWPNDVLISGRKTGGILLEGEADPGGGAPWVIVGIGVNLDHHPTDTPYPATCLRAEGAQDMDIEALLESLVARFAAWYAQWGQQGFEPVRAAWLEKAHNLGGALVARLSDESVEGRFVDLDVSGELVLETSAGLVMKINAADIYFPQAE